MALLAALHPLLEEEGGDDEVMPTRVGSHESLQTSPTQPTIPTPKSGAPHLPTVGALSRRGLVPQPSDPAVPGVWGHLRHLLTQVPRPATSEALGAGAVDQGTLDVQGPALAEQPPVPATSNPAKLPLALPAPPAPAASAKYVLRGELSEAEKRAVAAAQLKLEKAKDRKAPAACTLKGGPGAGLTPPSRGPWGSLGSFAGRRPPSNPEKLELFKELKQAYENIIKSRKLKSEVKSQGTDRQKLYWSFMQDEMKSGGSSNTTSPKETFAAAVAKWKNLHTEPVDEEEPLAEEHVLTSEEPQAEEHILTSEVAAEHPPGQGCKRKAPEASRRITGKMSVPEEGQQAKKK